MNVTQAELTAALIRLRDPRVSEIRFEGYATSSYLARDLLADIEKTQRNSPAEPEGDDFTFTQGELIRALELIGYGRHGRANTESWVRVIKEDIRGPKWKPGDVIKSAQGKVLVRTGTGRWYRPDDGVVFDDKRVSRPVTVLHKGA